MHRIVIGVLLVSSIVLSAQAQTSARRRAAAHPATPAALPIAAADSYSLSEGTVLTVAAPGVLANDTLRGASLASFGAATGAEHTAVGTAVQTAQGGSLNISAGGGFTYTPSGTFRGTDSFKYVIRNAAGSASATVTIAVSAVQATAVDDSYTTAPESSFSVPAPGVLTNDILAGGAIASFGANSGTEQKTLGRASPTGAGGIVTLAADGGFSYDPPPNVDDGYGATRSFVGQDTFRYVIQRDSVSVAAYVRVTVEPPSSGADYVVTTPGHYYAISTLTGENPVLRLTRGRTYRFQIGAAAVHPFAILDAPPGAVTNNNITSGTLTFSVPLTAQSYRYRCSTHGFGNVIETVP